MSAGDAFLDTSVVLYLLSDEAAKADRTEELLSANGRGQRSSAQRVRSGRESQAALSLPEIREVLGTIRTLCVTHPLTRGAAISGSRSQSDIDSRCTIR